MNNNQDSAIYIAPLQRRSVLIRDALPVQFKRLDPAAPVPTLANRGDAGADLYATVKDPLVLEPGQCELIGTGIAIYIRDPRYCGLIVPRSGLGHKNGIVLGNGTGVIDCGYQGELKVSLWNRSGKAFTVLPEMRIAQLLIVPVMAAQFIEVEEFSASDRGTDGFGSSGL
jgi:dUTP pyrophosphatase